MAEDNTQRENRTDEALTSIAEAYYRGILGMKQDYKSAFRYYSKAASMGNPSAMNMVARCYEKGQGVEKNLVTAIDWYESAYDKGSVAAAVRLGDFNWNGVPHIMQKDRNKASTYYQRAFLLAKQYNDIWDAADVYLRIADCLYEGVGFERDVEMAEQYYSLAFNGYLQRMDAGDSDLEEYLDRAEDGKEKCEKELGITDSSDDPLPEA